MNKRFFYLLIRYLLLLILSLGGLWIFYFVFTPLTIYPVLYLLKLFGATSLLITDYFSAPTPVILFKDLSIFLVSACIAGSAYYLLVILNLATPMPLKTRLKALAFSLLVFLVFNILRIVFFSILLVKSFTLFELAHLIFWYFISVLVVLGIWFAEIKLFNIKTIPVYSDLKLIYSKIR